MNKTLLFLVMEFETSDIPLEKICLKYFNLDIATARRRASAQKLPIPAYKCGSQKSPWMVKAEDLAKYIDSIHKEAQKDWTRINGQKNNEAA